MQPSEALLNKTRNRMQAIDTPNQVLGRSQTIGCVAVEITQKCNLDCTLCYLSEHSQQVEDIPLPEVFRRLDGVLEEFGAGTHVQITGGDPTLRKHSELIEIVRYARSLGLFPALFTNGIGATRKLLQQLAAAGLADVAFHVDSTQQRPGFSDEQSLNSVRLEYLVRARGLGLTVLFNTTIHNANIREMQSLVEFFVRHADEIGLVSFNLQAETGRGVMGGREDEVSQASIRRHIEAGVGGRMPWDAVRVGHHRCHNYLPALVVNGSAYPAMDDPEFFAMFLEVSPTLATDRHLSRPAVFFKYAGAILKRPIIWWPGLRYVGRQIKRMGLDLVCAGGRVHKLTFFAQNFMDAEELDEERIEACSFMVMTADGPVSMCEHNAARDDFILKPLDVQMQDGSVKRYEPLPVKVRVEGASATVC